MFIDVWFNNSLKSIDPKLSLLLRIEVDDEDLLLSGVLPIREENFYAVVPRIIKLLQDLLLCNDRCWLLFIRNIRLIENIQARWRPSWNFWVYLFDSWALFFLIYLLHDLFYQIFDLIRILKIRNLWVLHSIVHNTLQLFIFWAHYLCWLLDQELTNPLNLIEGANKLDLRVRFLIFVVELLALEVQHKVSDVLSVWIVKEGLCLISLHQVVH